MELDGNYKIGDSISYMYNGKKKVGKFRAKFKSMPGDAEFLGLDGLKEGEPVYIIETSKKSEDGIIIDNLVMERDILTDKTINV